MTRLMSLDPTSCRTRVFVYKVELCAVTTLRDGLPTKPDVRGPWLKFHLRFEDLVRECSQASPMAIAQSVICK